MLIGRTRQGDARYRCCQRCRRRLIRQDCRFAFVPMSEPHLRAEPVRIVRRLESQRNTSRRRHKAKRRDSDWRWTTARNDYIGYVVDRNARVYGIEVLCSLIVQMSSEPGAKPPPTCRIQFDSGSKLNRIVRKCIRRSATNVLSRSQFGNWLNVFIDWEVEANARDDLIGTIQQGYVIRALWIAGQDITKVSR